MIARSIARSVLVGVLAAAGLGAAHPCLAQSIASHPSPAGVDGADMAIPDDLGAPLPGGDQMAGAAGRLSVDTPIERIASNPQGKAVLERRLPGLCERPEYMMFKGMSLTKLADMSHGRISQAKVAVIQADLVRVDASGAPPTRRYGLFTQGTRDVRLLSHAVYKRVLIVVGSL